LLSYLDREKVTKNRRFLMKKTSVFTCFAFIFLLIIPFLAYAAEGDPYSFDNPPPGAENPVAGTGEPPLTDNPNGDNLMSAMSDATLNQQGIQQTMSGTGIQAKNMEATPTPVSENEQMFKEEVSIEQKSQTKEQMEKDVSELFKEGKKYYDNEDYDAAAEIWQRILINYPTASTINNIRYSLASAYEYSKQYEKAIDQYQKMLGEKPKSDMALEASYRLAGCYAYLQKWQYAMEIYRDIVRKEPNKKESIRAYFNIAAIYLKTEKFKKVSNIYLSIIRNYSGTSWEMQARFQLASMYAMTARYKSAINEYKIIKYKFKDTEWAPRAALHIGDVYKLAGLYKDAKEAYSRVMYEYYKDERIVQQAEAAVESLKYAKAISDKYGEDVERHYDYIIRGGGGGLGGYTEWNTGTGEITHKKAVEAVPSLE
jgi:tetratricopeptide (TPR) repeat protein